MSRLIWNWYQAHPATPDVIGWTWFSYGNHTGARQVFDNADGGANYSVDDHPMPNDGYEWYAIVVKTSPAPGKRLTLGEPIQVTTKLVRGKRFPAGTGTGSGGNAGGRDGGWHSPCHVTWSIRGGFNLVC